MTQLQTIINNHISLECHCGHRKLVSVKELISKLNPAVTIYEVARKAKCSHCDTKGVADLSLPILTSPRLCSGNGGPLMANKRPRPEKIITKLP